MAELLAYATLLGMCHFENKLWVLGGLLVTLEGLKSVWAIMAPSQVIMSFQSSGGIGLT